MRSDQGGKAQSRFTPPPVLAPIFPASEQHWLLNHISPEEAFFPVKKKTGHAMRFISAGGKKEQLDTTCWR